MIFCLGEQTKKGQSNSLPCVIEKELEDGGLIVSARVGHVNQVLPIVRYWIPHIRIISPEGLQGEMEGVLRVYLERG